MRWRKTHIMAMGAVLVATMHIYGPSLHFGLIWDDPLWYGRVAHKSLGELLAPMPDFQFYRPGTMLYNALFVSERGTLAPYLLHTLQITWHLLNVVLLAAFVRHLGCTRWQASAAAALFAFHPFNFQAVAWAAPMQPLVTTLLLTCWLTFLAAQRRPRQKLLPGASVAIFALALPVQESVIVMSPLPLLLSAICFSGDRWAPGFRKWLDRQRLALTYPALATLYLLFWITAPRAAGFTELAWRTPVALYLSQSISYPLLGRPLGYASLPESAAAMVALAAVATTAILLLLARRAGQFRPTLFGLSWSLLGLLPTLIGLRYSYVSVGSRLAYGAVPGIALLWAVALLPRHSRLARWAGAAVLAAIVLQSAWMLSRFNTMWQAGAELMDDMIAINDSHQSDQLFVNFPDRYAPRRSPYPLGYWGLTLAPVTVSLSDFTMRQYGASHPAGSLSAPWLDTVERAEGPYDVDLRGSAVTADTLYEMARKGKELFVTRYDREGQFTLQRAGQLTVNSDAADVPPCLAIFEDAVCLQGLTASVEGATLELLLLWRSLAPLLDHDTVFLHVEQPGILIWGQEDGDAWRSLLPLTVWTPGDTIEDQRTIYLPHELPAAGARLNLGIYNRVTGQRLPATDANGNPLPMNTYSTVVMKTE